MTKKVETVEKTVKPPKAGRLATEPQPTPQAKSEGWERKRQRQAIADKIMKYKNLPYTSILEIRSILKKEYKAKDDFDKLAKLLNVETVSLEDVHMFTYAFSEKYILDWIDRNLEKAPQKMELGGEDGQPIKVDLELSDAIKQLASIKAKDNDDK
jgi:hypothetical protein